MPKGSPPASAAPLLIVIIALVFVTHTVLSGVLWIFPDETVRLTGATTMGPEWDSVSTMGPVENEMFPAAPVNSVYMQNPTVIEPVMMQPGTSTPIYTPLPVLPPPAPTTTTTITTTLPPLQPVTGTCGNGFLVTGDLSHIPPTFDLSPCFDSCTQDPGTAGTVPTMSCTGFHCPEGCRLPQGSQPAACTTCANITPLPETQPTLTITTVQTILPPPLPPPPVCKISGNPCSAAAECCSGLACINGACSVFGVPPILPLCLAGGQRCAHTGECCGGLACTNGVCAQNVVLPPPPPQPTNSCTAGYYCKGQFMSTDLPIPCTAQESGDAPAVCCDAKDLTYKGTDCQPTTCSDGIDNNPEDHADIASTEGAFRPPYRDATEPNCYNCSLCAEAAMKEEKKTPPLIPYRRDREDSLAFDPKKDESTPCEAGQNPIASTFLGSLLEKTGLLAAGVPCARRCRADNQCLAGQECGRTRYQINNNEAGTCQNRQWRQLNPPHRIPWCSKDPLYTLPVGDPNRLSAALYVSENLYEDRAVCEQDANIGRNVKCCTTGDLATASSCSDARVNAARVNDQWVNPCSGNGKNGFIYEVPGNYNAGEAITCTDNNRTINQEDRTSRYMALQYSNGDPLPQPWNTFYNATCSRVYFAVYQTLSGRTSAICTNTPIFSCDRTVLVDLFPGGNSRVFATECKDPPPHYYAPPFQPASPAHRSGERVFDYAFNTLQTCQQNLRQPYYLNEGDDCTYSFPCRRGFTCKEQNPGAQNVTNRNARCVLTSSIAGSPRSSRNATPNGFLRGGITCSGQANDAQCAPGTVCGTAGGNNGGNNAGGNQNNNQQRTCCIADTNNNARCALNKTGNEQRIALYTFAGQIQRYDGAFIALYNRQCAIGQMQNNNGGQGNGLSPSVCAFFNLLYNNIAKLNGTWRG